MKYFSIILIACLLGMQEAKSEGSSVLPKDTIMEECTQELNVPFFRNVRVYPVLAFISAAYPGPKTNKMSCLAACTWRKLAESRGSTLYEATLASIENGQGPILHEEYVTFTREELKLKVETCYAKERSECDFFNCLRDSVGQSLTHPNEVEFKEVILPHLARYMGDKFRRMFA